MLYTGIKTTPQARESLAVLHFSDRLDKAGCPIVIGRCPCGAVFFGWTLFGRAQRGP